MEHIERVDNFELATNWSEIEDALWKSVHNSERTEFMSYLQHRLYAGLDQLWKVKGGNEQGYAVTTFYGPLPGVLIAQVQMLSVEGLESFESHIEEFEAFAAKNGATQVEIIGRKGWERKLAPYGYTHEHTALRKTLYGGVN